MSIEKLISPFIESQFPQFYQEEGPLFIEFMKAYYEWMETENNILNISRSLMEYRDIDKTLSNFLIYFKNKYINSLPENIMADKKLLIKHILDLYRSKGTDASYRLLFRLLFNEDIEIYVPGKFLFKPSDGEWVRPQYIEVSDNPFLENIIGKKIYSASTLSKAIVENYYTVQVKNKLINVLVISNLEGNFKYGDKILCDDLYVKRYYDNNTGYYDQNAIFTGVLNYKTLTVSSVEGNIVFGQTVYAGKARVGTIISGSGNTWKMDLNGNITSRTMTSSFNLDTTTKEFIDNYEYSKLSQEEKNNYILGLNPNNGPFIFGSLTSVSIVNGGLGYNVGDYLNIENSGGGGIAVVRSTRNKNGEVTFDIIKGGTGFSLDANVSVDGKALDIKMITATNPVVVTTFNKHDLQNSNSVRIDYVNGMTQINKGSYTYFIKVIDEYSFELYDNLILTNTTDGTTFFPYTNGGYVYVNTGGFGATFKIGSIVDKELYRLNIDHIIGYIDTVIDDRVEGYYINIDEESTTGIFSEGDYPDNPNYVTMDPVDILEVDCEVIDFDTQTQVGETLSNTELGITNLTIVTTNDNFLQIRGLGITDPNLVPGVILTSNISNSIIKINTKYPIKQISGYAIIRDVFSNKITVQFPMDSDGSYFIPGETLRSSAGDGATSTIVSVDRLTDWYGLGAEIAMTPPHNYKNLDVPLSVLIYIDKEVGTIASLTAINPGSGYAEDPVVTIIEPLIYDLQKKEAFGTYKGTIKGFNSQVKANAVNASGIVTSIEVVDSGFGYDRDQEVFLRTIDNNYSVTGTTVVDTQGVSKGYWKDHKGFLSDKYYLQDSNYYQKYSYEIIVSKMMDMYEDHVKNLVHPVGIKLFGRFLMKNEISLNPQTIVYNYITQNIEPIGGDNYSYNDDNAGGYNG